MKTDLTSQINRIHGGSLIYELMNNEAFESLLLKEFIKTPLQKDHRKWICKVEGISSQLEAYHKGELLPGSKDRIAFDDILYEQDEIFNSLDESEVPKDCYSHDLTHTPIYKTIDKIDVMVDHFKREITVTEAECKIITNLIDTFDFSIRETVANALIANLDDTNMYLVWNMLTIDRIKLGFKKTARKKHLQHAETWNLSKIHLQSLLIDYVKELTKPKESLQPETQEAPLPAKDFFNLLECEPSVKQILKPYLKNRIPERKLAFEVVAIICALGEKGYLQLGRGKMNQIWLSVNAEFGTTFTRAGYIYTYKKLGEDGKRGDVKLEAKIKKEKELIEHELNQTKQRTACMQVAYKHNEF